MYIAKLSGAALLLVSVGWAFQARAACDHTPNPNEPRSAVPDACTWNLTHLYATPEAWEAEFTAVSAEIPKIGPACEGKLSSDAPTLRACLDTTYALLQRVYQLDTYAGRAFDQDQSVEETKKRSGRVQMLMPTFADEVSFMEPEILAMDKATIDGWMAQDKDLALYGWYFENIFRMKPHTLTPGEERLMALAGNVLDAPYYAHEALLNEDISFPEITNDKGEKEPLTVTGFTLYRGSTNPEVRKEAATTFFTGLSEYENTFASDLDGIVKAHIFTKQARGYDSCLQASLTPDDIDPAVYHQLVDTVNANLPRTLHKYVALRRRVLGVEGPLTFDNLYNPLLGETQQRTWTYDEGVALILQALKPMGPDYMGFLEEGLDPANGWVDVYPNAKKDSGAYMSGSAYAVHPYVMLNHNNDLESVFTVAHEYGHAMHSYYSNRAQPFVYADYATFNAEIASTTNEELLLSYLLATTPKKDVDTRLMLLNQRLENIRLTIFRQTLFAEFELAIHEYAEQGNPLTAEFLNKTYGDLIQKYYGPDFQLGEHDASEWAFIPHFYYDFYVFSYATGLTSGIAIAQQILDKKQGAVHAQRYKDAFLSAGSSRPPLTILQNAGVDLTTPAPIVSMLDLFEQTVAEFEATWAKKTGAK
jgi:oligoendopeptidase F